MRTPWRVAALACVLVSIAALGQGEERPWLEVRSPRFTVVSQSGEKSARDMAWQFEQVHSVFAKAYPWARLESGRPFVVLVVRNEAALRELSPAFWAGYKIHPGAAFVSAAGRDFVGIRNDLGGPTPNGENPYTTAYHGYVSIVLDASFPGVLPLWFHKGMQGFFGNTLVRDKDVHVGRLINSYLERLNTTARFSIPELVGVDRDSPIYRGETSRFLFDAESWLFVHYLFFGENGTLLPKLNRYASLLRNGTPGPEAFKAAFEDVDALEKGLNAYVTRRLYRYTQLDLDVNVDRATFRTRPMPPSEVAALKAAYVLAMREPAASAHALAQQALKANPDEPLAYEVLGLIADAEDRDADAADAYGKAMDRGSQGYYAHYRLAQLLWKPDNDSATLARMAAALEKATRINPDSPWAQSYLAEVRVRLDDPAGAREPARKAVALAPGEPSHRRTLARVLGELGQLDDATAEAGRSLALAKTDEQKRQGREMLSWLASKKLAPVMKSATPSTAALVATTTEAARTKVQVLDEDTHPCATDDARLCAWWLAESEKACGAGSLEACSSAGWAYTGGRTAPRDPVKAAPLLEKACTGGLQPACVNLAVVLANRKAPDDMKRAMELATGACAAGVEAACDLKAQLKIRQR